MTVTLYIFTYAAAVTFISACAVRIVWFARAPLHLRWELYPVPHEPPARAEHGGSYFEEVDWWTRPSRFHLFGELRFMIPEILFMKGLWEFNRRLWFRSFPFHFGLYLLTGAAALMGLGGALSISDPAFAAGTLGQIIHGLCRVTGISGMALAVLGAMGLLVRRLTDHTLRIYTTPGDIFNLLFFLVTLGLSAAGYWSRSPTTPGMIALTKGLLTFDSSLEIPGLLASGLFLWALLIAYVPTTHMSHFIAKYFTYHAVRWDDAPTRRGSSLEARLAGYLTYRPTWAAAHVGADGDRTWAEVAATNPAQESKK